jgi:hypothetical protein
MSRAAISFAFLVGLCAVPVQAGVIFFDNDLAGFNAAVASYTHIGTEDFEESTLADGGAVAFLGPLSQTSTTSPYPNGILQPIVVTATSGNLAALNDASSIVSTAVVAQSGAATLDWSFNTSDNLVAVGLNPITTSGNNSTKLNTVSVFDTSDVFLDSITVDANDAGSFHLGILATGLSRIGRINFHGTTATGAESGEGGDNAALYSSPIPEPASALLAALAALGLMSLSRRRG